jgi:hypothetical protein
MLHVSSSKRRRASAGGHEQMGRWVRGLLGVGVAAAALAMSPTVARAGAAASQSPFSHAPRLGNLTGISCVSSSVCMVTGEVDDVSGGSVIGTTNGGRTWQQLAAPPGVDALAAVACATAVICEVVGSGNGDAGAIYGTINGGQSWTTQPAVIVGGFFLGVACPSIDVCEATGNEGMIFGTLNGGASWKHCRPDQRNLLPLNHHVRGPRRSAPNIGWRETLGAAGVALVSTATERRFLLFAHELRRRRHQFHPRRATGNWRAGLHRRRWRHLDPPTHPERDRRPDERGVHAIWHVRGGRTGLDRDHRVDKRGSEMDSPSGPRVPLSPRCRVPGSADVRGCRPGCQRRHRCLSHDRRRDEVVPATRAMSGPLGHTEVQFGERRRAG